MIKVHVNTHTQKHNEHKSTAEHIYMHIHSLTDRIALLTVVQTQFMGHQKIFVCFGVFSVKTIERQLLCILYIKWESNKANHWLWRRYDSGSFMEPRSWLVDIQTHLHSAASIRQLIRFLHDISSSSSLWKQSVPQSLTRLFPFSNLWEKKKISLDLFEVCT